MKASTKLNRILASALTILFLGFVFLNLGITLVNDGESIYDSLRLMSQLKGYLPEDYNALDMLNARIQSFTSQISDSFWMKDEMGYLNSAFQYALGKKMITTGGQNMVTLTTGHLYDLQADTSMESGANNVIAIRDSLPEDTPFLFVYEHPTLYRDDMLPSGYEALDHSKALAEDVIARLEAGGIEVMDSREVLNNSGFSLEDLLMYTDQHWSTLSALVMARDITARASEITGIALDPSLLDIDQMNTEVYEKRFLGKYGQRVGTGVIDPDDLIVYWPKYDTEIFRSSLRTTSYQDVCGDFRTAVVREDRLEPQEGKSYNTIGYTYYGQVEAYDFFINPSAPDITIMLIKDSYSAPIGAFLSLVARNVISIDIRHESMDYLEWVEKYDPDIVVMSYSLQMLRNDQYEFM